MKIKTATKLTLFSMALIFAFLVLMFLVSAVPAASKKKQAPSEILLISDSGDRIFASPGWSDAIGATESTWFSNGATLYTFTPPDQTSLLIQIVLLILPVTVFGLILFVVSSVLVDRILNPVEIMTEKVREIGKGNFSSKLTLNTADDILSDYCRIFNQMSSRLNDYIARQKRFVSDASHELTTPITIIKGHTDLLLRWGKKDPAILEEKLKIIQAEAGYMNTLVEDLLFFARTDNKAIQYQFTQLSLNELLEECIGEMAQLYPDSVFIREGSGDFFLYGDHHWLKRTFIILLNNAVKYGGEDQRVMIRTRECNKELLLEFADHGIGIGPEDLSRIFDRFYRVENSRSKATGGTGLGLAIAKEVVIAHGGRIFAESCLNKGTTFKIFMKPSSPDNNKFISPAVE